MNIELKLPVDLRPLGEEVSKVALAEKATDEAGRQHEEAHAVARQPASL